MQPLPDDDFSTQHDGWPCNLEDRDARLVLAAVLDLTDDARTRHEPVRVSAQNDVVILLGTVASWEARDAAAAVARGTPGARDLCNALRVADDAGDRADVDEFDRLVATMDRPLAEDEMPARPLRGRRDRWTVPVTASAWGALPLAIGAGHLPALPVLLVVLAVTFTVFSIKARSLLR
ncbi:BON domain-containing protein [Actinoplanes sp. NPDC051411]|uniref:BON domain-containing protein n=1 Tax=Actinoplanes sp. NPDC051411 TaxID=3155522 RepID=UPI00342A54B0